MPSNVLQVWSVLIVDMRITLLHAPSYIVDNPDVSDLDWVKVIEACGSQRSFGQPGQNPIPSIWP